MKRICSSIFLPSISRKTWKRSYYSQTVIPGLNRRNPWQLQMDIPKDAPPVSGYNYVMQRFANMAFTIAERAPTRVLHIFPESSFVVYLGEHTNFMINGLSAYSVPQTFYGRNKYARIESVANNTVAGKAEKGSYELVGHLLPLFKRTDSNQKKDETTNEVELLSPSAYQLEDLIHATSQKGYIVIGYPEAFWQYFDLENQINHFHGSGTGFGLVTFQASFKIPLAEEDLIPITLEEFEKTHSNQIISYSASLHPDKLNDNIPSVLYRITVLRKN